MSEDINVNALAEAINDKMDRDAGNITSPMLPVFLVDVQYPTADNDYTWYRLYSDGWVEQGGYGNNTSITLPISMALPTQYTAVVQYNPVDGDVSNGAITVTTKTATGFVVRRYSTGTDEFSWQVSGMSALPAVNPIGLLENTMKKVVDGEGVVDTTKLNSAETSIASFLNI